MSDTTIKTGNPTDVEAITERLRADYHARLRDIQELREQLRVAEQNAELIVSVAATGRWWLCPGLTRGEKDLLCDQDPSGPELSYWIQDVED